MIDPTSKDDPKFKELVKVRGTPVSAFLLGCGGRRLGRVGVEGKGPSPRAGPAGQGSSDRRAGGPMAASGRQRWLLSP